MKKYLLIVLLYFPNFEINSQIISGNESKLWTKTDKEYLLINLERTKKDVFTEIKSLSVDQWNFKEDSTRWSIAEIIEHLITQDDKYLIEITICLSQPELPEYLEKTKGNDQIFKNYVNDELKATAGILSPIGRYCTKEKSEFLYNRIRQLLFDKVNTSNDDFRKHFTFRNYKNTGFLTEAEKYNVRDMHQLLLTCIAHTDRHLNQLRKVKKHPNYPKI